MEKQFLRVDEVADMARCSECTVRRWVSEGRIVALHAPGRLLFKRSEVLQFLGDRQGDHLPESLPALQGS